MKKTLLALLLSSPLALGSVAWGQPTEVQIQVQPADALIFVDREMRGQGNTTLTDLLPGQHLLRVSAGEDWETETQPLNVSASSPTTVRIVLKPGGAKLLRQGRQMLEQGDTAGAVSSFRKAAAARPVAAAWWEGIAEWRAGNTRAAIAAFRRYAQYQPNVPQLHYLLGTLQEKAHQPGAAFTAYKTAALLQPELARSLEKLPKPTEAEIAKLRNSKSPYNLMRLGQLLMLKGKMAEANTAVKLALAPQIKHWSQQNWLEWEPPMPPPAKIEVAPPEDLEP